MLAKFNDDLAPMRLIRGFRRKEHRMPAARRVLIVEDEEVLADNLKARFERVVCDARIADSASAISPIAEFSPRSVGARLAPADGRRTPARHAAGLPDVPIRGDLDVC